MTHHNQIRLCKPPKLPVHRRQPSPGNDAVRRVLDQRDAEDGVDAALADGAGQERRVAHGVPRRLVADIAVVGARDGGIGKAKDADGDVVTVPVRAVGQADLLLRHRHAAARDVAVAHRARDALARAVLEVKVQLVNLPVAEAVNVRLGEAAGRLAVSVAAQVRALEARLGRPRVGAARVEEQPDGHAVPAALDGVLRRGIRQGADVLKRLLEGAGRVGVEAASHAAERGHGRVLLARPSLDALEMREVHRGAVLAGLLDGFDPLEGEAVHGLCEVPVGGVTPDLGEAGGGCSDDEAAEEADEPLREVHDDHD